MKLEPSHHACRPTLRLYTMEAAPAKLSQGQKKKLRQKKKAEAAKAEQTGTPAPSESKSDSAAPAVGVAPEPEIEFTLEEEIQWCVDQLKLGQKRKGATADQIEESNQVIKKLQSTKRPLPFKRHLMHVVFGDYRGMMKEERLNKIREAKEKEAKAAAKAAQKEEKESESVEQEQR